MTLQQEWFTLLAMIVCGIYLGMATDTYRTVLTPFFKKRLAIGILEVLYWLCQTAIVYYILYKMNNGILRFYFFLACLLGYSIYIVTLQYIYMKCMHVCIKFGHIICRLLYQIFLWPILMLLQFIFKMLQGCCYFVFQLLNKVIFRPLYRKCHYFIKDSKIITILCSFYSTIYTKLKFIWKR